MPVNPTYPGVYVEEISSGVHTIIGVATSITAFAGRAQRGPVDKPVTVNSFGDFERVFGGLWEGSKLGFAVRDFFLNGGSQALVVRLFSPVFADAQAVAAALAQAQTDAQAAADAVAKAATDAGAEQNATPVSVMDETSAAAGTFGADKPGAYAAAQAVLKAAQAAADAEAAAISPDPKKIGVAATAAKASAVASGKATARPKATLDANGLALEAADPGAWGSSLRARVDDETAPEVAAGLNVAPGDLFNLTLYDTKTRVTEVFRNVTVAPSARQVDRVLLNESRLARVSGSLPATRPAAHSAPAAGKSPWEDDAASSKVADDGLSSDGVTLVQGDFTGSGKEAAHKGLYALDQADLFNLLCIPPYLPGGDIDADLIDEATAYCQRRRAFMIIDPPTNWATKEAAKDGIATDVGSVSEYSAVFFPRLKQANPLHQNQIEEFVPSGAVAGIFARTDANRGVWKAPAGLEATLNGVRDLKINLSDRENGELNPLGVNCLRTFAAAGQVVWGSRTRAGDDRLTSEWKYIPVRRLALYVEESLYRGTQWVVFEPNDEPLWSQIRLNVGAFMNGLFRQGAFQGRTPREAYLVKCDRETTTQDDINRGVVNIVVGFAPLKPAEFVIIQIQQLAGQITV